MRLVVFGVLLTSLTMSVTAAPWMQALGLGLASPGTTVETVASVEVSDGLEYEVHTIWIEPERVMMRRTENDVSTIMAVEGWVNWAHNGSRYQELESKYADFIRGHQYHALLLQFEAFAPLNLAEGRDKECECSTYRGEDESGNQFTAFLAADGMPARLKVEYKEFGAVTSELGGWQVVNGVSLPMQIEIQDGERRFTYRYTEISLSNNRLFRSYLPPIEILGDEAAIYRLHRDMIDAHLVSDASLMQHIWPDDIVMVNRGNITKMPGSDASAGMQASLAIREHNEYKDLLRPVISVSEDGTLAWLAARVSASGTARPDDGDPRPFEFVSAWLATFSKEEGGWRMTANASNFE